ncbi:MAG: NPCBM/NEW2 domain-containing protein, partial [Kiritimatiellaeota bacterium]|nr:NPCBM/NEW2 domain-containing protein [Kiritimatiellota bacterium]
MKKNRLIVTWLACALCALSLASPATADDRKSPVATKTVWLDELNLANASQGSGTPQKNKAVGGGPLTLGGRKFERGFGTHAVSRLLVNLKGAVLRFSATVGVDDADKDPSACLEFLVHANGKVLWKSGLMKAGQPPQTCSVDLTGAPAVMLAVNDGGNGINWDFADWADAKFETTADAVLETLGGPAGKALLRSMALTDPRLNFSDLLFIERGILGGSEYDGKHCCDQYYGHNGRPGGG